MTAQEKYYQLDQASTGSEGWAQNDVLWACLYFARELLCGADRFLSQCPEADVFRFTLYSSSHHKLHPDGHHSTPLRPLFSPPFQS